ncbi:hypothetical protein [Arcobacter sp.]|uniref:hypothetical protein n=1 Tax=Arcobacter sp. TaxID=1872629 RepID=UPI003D0BDF6C
MNENKLKSLLQYKSNEMIPSTHLIRKSKLVFDAIQYNKIEKAVILRDGKPSFMLMDFEKYEELINFFINNNMSIDKELALLDSINTEPNPEVKVNKEINEIKKETNKVEKSSLLEKLDSIEGVINNDKTEIQDNLKDFWE